MTLAGVGAFVLVLTWLQGPQVGALAAVPADGTRLRVLAIEDSRNPTAVELAFLIDLARRTPRTGSDGIIRFEAIRALGRLERRELVPVLSGLLEDRWARGAAEQALLVTLRAHALSHAPDIEAATDAVLRGTNSGLVLRHLPYTKAAQVAVAERKLLALAKNPLQHNGVAGSFEGTSPEAPQASRPRGTRA